MFNVENAIQTWRRQLAESGITSARILDELESHLREEVDEQIRSGQSPEDAFKLALSQMGHSQELGAEFSKLRASGAQKPKYLSAFCFSAAALIAISAVGIFPEIDAKASIGRALAATGILGIIAYLAALPFCSRRLPDVRRPVVGQVLKFGSLLVSFWVLLALLSALQVVQVKLDEATVQLFWAAVPAFFATLLAYNGFGLSQNVARRQIVKAISPDANQALELARREAIHLGHDFIGTEHLLLGLLQSENRIAVNVLKKFGLSEDVIRAAVEEIVGPGSEQSRPKAIPYTPRARSVLDFAGHEASAMGRGAVGPEHLLLGLLREPTGVAGVVLRKLGADVEQARSEILKSISPDDTAGSAPAVAA